MNAGTMEGLIGAGINMKLVDTPMRVYREAERRGDLGVMERAMGYATDYTNTAYEYKEQAEKELRKEMQENREEQKRELEEAIKERREANKETQKETVEKLAAKAGEMREGNGMPAQNTNTPQTDSVVISAKGQELLRENLPAPDSETPDISKSTNTDTKFYSSTGTTMDTPPVGMNVSVDV